MERNRQKLVGRDKGSLTEQQTKGIVTTMTRVRRILNTNHTTPRAASTAVHSGAVSEFPPPSFPVTGTQHDGTWYGIPGSVWPGCVSPPGCAPSLIPVKINPVVAEPRTLSYMAIITPERKPPGHFLHMNNPKKSSSNLTIYPIYYKNF